MKMKELIILSNQSNLTIFAIQTWSEYQNTDELLDLDTNGRIIHYTKKCEVPSLDKHDLPKVHTDFLSMLELWSNIRLNLIHK